MPHFHTCQRAPWTLSLLYTYYGYCQNSATLVSVLLPTSCKAILGWPFVTWNLIILLSWYWSPTAVSVHSYHVDIGVMGLLKKFVYGLFSLLIHSHCSWLILVKVLPNSQQGADSMKLRQIESHRCNVVLNGSLNSLVAGWALAKLI